MEATVDSLPDEILEIIFSHSSHSDLVHSIQNVCCRWREVAQSTRVWKNVTYCPDSNTRSEQVVEMLEISPKLQNIILEYIYDDRVLQAITDNCAELRKLEVIKYLDLCLNFIKNVQKKCPKVQYLSIPYRVLTDLCKCEVVGKFTNLKVLHLTGHPITRLLMKFKPIADHCKELEDLEIGNDRFKMNDFRYLLSMRKDTLHTLGVTCCNKYHECVLPALSTCELRSLSLFSYWDCRKHYEKIEYFGQLRTVRALSIKEFDSEKESDDLKQIFENENMAQLVELKINDSHYFNDSVTEVIIRNCPLLKHLSLMSCYNMTDASLKLMVNLKELNSMTIYGNDCVTDAGIVHLQGVKCLKHLTIIFCKLGLGNIAKLSTLQCLSLEEQDLAAFPWDVIPHHMQYLQCLCLHSCSNVDMCAIEKLKMLMPFLKVEVLECYEDCASEDSL